MPTQCGFYASRGRVHPGADGDRVTGLAATAVEGVVTRTIAMPWAAVEVVAPERAPVLELLEPYAVRARSDGERHGIPLVAAVRFQCLERCSCAEEAETDGGEPIVLHHGCRGRFYRCGSDHLVVNQSRGVHYHVEHLGTPVVTCCVPGGRPGLDGLQIVRGLLVGEGMQTKGLAPLNGAVLRMDDGYGVLLAGGREADKTSFALGLLTLPGPGDVALICTDRSLLDTETLRAYGLPYAITINSSALAQLPMLADLARRHQGPNSFYWPADVAMALGFSLVSSVVLCEQWWCALDVSRLGTVLRSAPPPDEAERLAGFDPELLPVWLLEMLGRWVPRAPVRAIDVPAARVEGNPWRSWLPRPSIDLW